MQSFRPFAILLLSSLLISKANAQIQSGQKSIGFGVQNWSGYFSLRPTSPYRGDGKTGYTPLNNFGVGVFSSIRFKNPHFSMTLGISTLSQSGTWSWNDYSPTNTTSIDVIHTANFKESLLEVPLSFKYDFTSSGFRPFIEAGASFGFSFSRSISTTYVVLNPTVFPDGRPKLVFTDGDYAYFGGIGIAKKINRLDLQLHARYLQMQEYIVGNEINRTYMQYALTAMWNL